MVQHNMQYSNILCNHEKDTVEHFIRTDTLRRALKKAYSISALVVCFCSSIVLVLVWKYLSHDHCHYFVTFCKVR